MVGDKSGWLLPLQDLGQIEIDVDGEYPELGARSFGKGIFHKPTLKGGQLTWQKLFRVHEGDIVFSNIKAWEGAIVVAGSADHGRFGSHRYLTCVADPTLAIPEFICFYLLTRDGLESVGSASVGMRGIIRTLSMDRLQRSRCQSSPSRSKWNSRASSTCGRRSAVKNALPLLNEKHFCLPS